MKKRFKYAVLKLSNLDIHRRWYVEYQFLNPNTNNYKRFREYGGVNRIKKTEYRINRLSEIRDEINQKLNDGWNPFTNEFEKIPLDYSSLKDCFDFLILDRKVKLASSSYPSAKSIILHFKRFCDLKNLLKGHPNKVTRKLCHNYLDGLLVDDGKSKGTFNNHLGELKTCFNIMFEREIIEANPFARIKKQKAKVKRHVPFTMQQLKSIIGYLEKKDKYFLMFCAHIMLALRKTEILELQIGDYNWETNTILIPDFKTKNNKKRIVRIHSSFQKFFDCLHWSAYPKNYYVFGPNDGPQAKKHSNRDYYSKKFSVMRKELGFSRQQTLYGLKHTLICHLADQKLSIGELMQYGGFSTVDALQRYLRNHISSPLRDLSDNLDWENERI